MASNNDDEIIIVEDYNHDENNDDMNKITMINEDKVDENNDNVNKVIIIDENKVDDGNSLNKDIDNKLHKNNVDSWINEYLDDNKVNDNHKHIPHLININARGTTITVPQYIAEAIGYLWKNYNSTSNEIYTEDSPERIHKLIDIVSDRFLNYIDKLDKYIKYYEINIFNIASYELFYEFMNNNLSDEVIACYSRNHNSKHSMVYRHIYVHPSYMVDDNLHIDDIIIETSSDTIDVKGSVDRSIKIIKKVCK